MIELSEAQYQKAMRYNFFDCVRRGEGRSDNYIVEHLENGVTDHRVVKLKSKGWTCTCQHHAMGLGMCSHIGAVLIEKGYEVKEV